MNQQLMHLTMTVLDKAGLIRWKHAGLTPWLVCLLPICEERERGQFSIPKYSKHKTACNCSL